MKIRYAIAGLIFVVTILTGFLSLRAEQNNTKGAVQPLIFPTPPPISGFLFVVTSTGDGDNVGTGATCDDGTGNCTLRAAIQVANANAGDDTIQFNIPTSDPGFSSGRWTIKLSKALPDIGTNVKIEGPDPDKLIVQRFVATSFRIFNITTAGTASFSGLTIASGELDDDNGGGIQNFNNGTVNITNCSLEQNSVFHIVNNNMFHARSGGAIYNRGSGTINISNSVLRANSSQDSGGAIANVQGTLNVDNSTISNNSTTDGIGGGIVNGTGGTVTITNSTIADNSANGTQEGIGGGIYNDGMVTVMNSALSRNLAAASSEGGGGIFNAFGATLTLANCTISTNFAFAGGGGISNGATVNITNCTITGNSVISGSGRGGGISGGASTNVKGCIIALNSASFGPDVDGALTSQGHNLVGKTFGNGFTDPSDKTGTFVAPLDPKLDSGGLKDNGGPTQTIALLAGSPAINAGPTDAAPTDQRGFVRVGPPDIGAFEFGATNFTRFLGNISTRGSVGTGDNVMIGGFVISGTQGKSVLLRAIGPSLANPPFNLTGTLQDPTLSLFSGSTLILSNDNWKDRPNSSFIPMGLQPTNDLESAIFTFLAPGTYTAIVSGVNGGTGIGLAEVYDMDQTVPSKLTNISTRGFVQTGDSVLIGGFIVNGQDTETVVVRAIGPSLADPPFNLTNVLQDPTLSLFDANGMMFAFNDNWKSEQQADIIATGLQPSNDAESAIVTTLTPGNYTAIVRGVNSTTGLALVEVFGLN